MEEQVTEKTELSTGGEQTVRGKNGGARPGAGRKVSIDLLKDEAKKLAMAEFWVDLAENKAIPRLKSLMDNPDDEVAWKGVKEVLDRAYGRPKESIDHTTLGKEIQPTTIQIVKPD